MAALSFEEGEGNTDGESGFLATNCIAGILNKRILFKLERERGQAGWPSGGGEEKNFTKVCMHLYGLI